MAAAAGIMHGFPAALTSFIGRDESARQVAGLLERHRLVTITGPGGAGKTRLAGELAKRVAARFADGAWLAELAPVSDAAQVAAVVAVALGIRDQPGTQVTDAVVRVRTSVRGDRPAHRGGDGVGGRTRRSFRARRSFRRRCPRTGSSMRPWIKRGRH